MSGLPVTVTGEQSHCLYLNPWAISSYFLPCPIEEAKWESGFVGIWQVAKVKPRHDNTMIYNTNFKATQKRDIYFAPEYTSKHISHL